MYVLLFSPLYLCEQVCLHMMERTGSCSWTLKCMCWNLWLGLAALHLRFIVLNGGKEEGILSVWETHHTSFADMRG